MAKSKEGSARTGSTQNSEDQPEVAKVIPVDEVLAKQLFVKVCTFGGGYKAAHYAEQAIEAARTFSETLAAVESEAP